MTMRRRTLHLLATGVLLLVLAYALPEPGPPPVGREATVLGAAASLWEDRDLSFGPGDRERVRRHWRGDVRGLALRPEPGGDSAGGFVYSVRPVYPVVAAPFYGLLGPRGPRVLDTALFLVVFWTAWRMLRHPSGPAGGRDDRRRLPRSGLAVSAFFFASVALAHVLRPTGAAFEMACVFLGLALWCRVRERAAFGRRELLPLAGAGVLLALAAVARPELAVLALAPAVDLAWGRRWKGAAVLVLSAAAAGGLLWAAGGAGGPADGAGVVVAGAQLPGDAGFEAAAAREQPTEGETVPRDFWYLLVGRHVGLLPYFPFALFAVGLYLADLRRPGNCSRHLLALSLLAYLGVTAVDLPGAAAAPAAPGLAAVAAVYPVFLFLPKRVRAGWGVLLPFAAAGLWTVPALVSAVRPAAPAAVLELHARGPTFQVLPLEMTLLGAGRLPGYVPWTPPTPGEAAGGETVWLVPVETFFTEEPNPEGVWVRGASRSEIYVATTGELAPVRLRLGSVSAENVVTVAGAGERTVVRFDTPAKRAGTPVTVRSERVASGLPMAALGGRRADVGRIVLTTTGGAVPARGPGGSTDQRYLGLFLGF